MEATERASLHLRQISETSQDGCDAETLPGTRAKPVVNGQAIVSVTGRKLLSGGEGVLLVPELCMHQMARSKHTRGHCTRSHVSHRNRVIDTEFLGGEGVVARGYDGEGNSFLEQTAVARGAVYSI